jgi:hypothetical protein
VSPQTPTHPPTEPSMWRRLLARAHPDSGGEHELFIWTQNLRDVVCNGHIVRSAPFEARPSYQRERRHHWEDEDKPRIPYDSWAGNFATLTRTALRTADEVGAPYSGLLLLLADCVEVYEGPLYKQQQEGATYKTLAAIAHAAGMDKEERVTWYWICESIPLSQRHAGHILSRLRRRWAA